MKTLTKTVIDYPFSPEKKTDIRDLGMFFKDGKKVWEYLSSRLIAVDMEAPEEDIVAEVCTSFNDLRAVYDKNLHWTQLAADSLAIAIAVVSSVRIKGPLLWAYLVGPSGCGKSTICDAISADHVHTKRVNNFTGLHSGYKTGDPDRPDVSLISKLPGKALIVPDFTTVLSMPQTSQEKLYGDLRNIYDGISSMHYGNDIERDYKKITFPFLAGVTPEIHALRKSALGERFLKVDMTDRSSVDHIIQRNIMNVAGSACSSLENNQSFDEVDELNPFMRIIKAHTLGFLQHLFRKIAGGVKVPFPTWFAEKIGALAAIVAASRGEAKRHPGADRDLAYRPVLEVGSHVGGQMAKLSIALCVVLDRNPDEEVLRLVKKVAVDTSASFSFDVIQALGNSPNGLTVEQLASKVRLPPTTVRKICQDLQEFEVVYKKSEETASGIAGREAHVMYLSYRMQSCWNLVFGSTPTPRQLTKT